MTTPDYEAIVTVLRLESALLTSSRDSLRKSFERISELITGSDGCIPASAADVLNYVEKVIDGWRK